jgi:hypothetical protein
LFFVLASLINWDATIADYNIAKSDVESVDYDYILSLSDKVLPTILEDKDFLKQNMYYLGDSVRQVGVPITPPTPPVENYPLSERVNRYLNVHDNYSFLSWNLSDDYLQEYFHSKGFKSRREVESQSKTN